MQGKLLLSFIGGLFLCQSSIYSQIYLGNDEIFFQKKAEIFQRWIEAQGMGSVLEVNKVQFEDGNKRELELWLSVRTTDPDTAIALWIELRKAFRMKNRRKKLNETLFNTFIRMMEIPAEQGNIQVYIPQKGGNGYNRCFYIWIWKDRRSIKSKEKLNNCKDLPITIKVDSITDLKHVGTSTSSVITSNLEKRSSVIFDKILQFVKTKYKYSGCDGPAPVIQVEEKGEYKLTFSVSNLCKVVLTEEKKSLWCNLVEYLWGPCNDMRRERLEFKIYYIPTSKGYRLDGELTGKFGSGIYRPRKSGYMDMDPDFEEDFLRPYLYNFQAQLLNFLKQ